MEGLDRWKFLDELNVFQISLLLAGHDPAPLERIPYSEWSDEIVDAVAPYLTSLKSAVRTGRLDTLFQPWTYDSEDIDWTRTLVDVWTLRVWLGKKGMPANFFDLPPLDFGSPLALDDPSSQFYSQKLAAAVAAWTAVTSDPARRRGKSPKRAVAEWLTENAAKLGLLNPDGTVNKQGIEEIAKVANWQPNGGAPKTPSALPEPTSPSLQTPGQVRPKPAHAFSIDDLDDDIPF